MKLAIAFGLALISFNSYACPTINGHYQCADGSSLDVATSISGGVSFYQSEDFIPTRIKADGLNHSFREDGATIYYSGVYKATCVGDVVNLASRYDLFHNAKKLFTDDLDFRLSRVSATRVRYIVTGTRTPVGKPAASLTPINLVCTK